MDTDLSEVPFTIILRGCDPESGPAIKEHIYLALEKIVKQGIPLEQLENA